MGVSGSSLLDETKSAFIKDQTEAELQRFSPYYRKQFSVAHFSQVEEDLEPDRDTVTQLLKHRKAPEEGEVLYEDSVLYFEDNRKWKERYVVVRANYCLECHDSLGSFVKGIPPSYKLLPTGGTVLTTEADYMAMVDKSFPDETHVKEDFAPPVSGMPAQFPVYLRLPYRRDSYFCFHQQAKQAAFISILLDCIRHQNHDFLKKKTCEVQAFLKAVRLYRQDRGQYEAWNMLIGSDVRVMANLVMEQLLPSLEKDMLPRLKAKKMEKKRVWFATVEAAYILVQEHLLEGLTALKQECRMSARQDEVLIHTDMDEIISTRRQLEEKIHAVISEPSQKLCSENIQPYLTSVLEELMQPISSGFQEGRQLSESMMDQACQDVLETTDEDVRKTLADMARPNLLRCYQKIGSLQETLHHLRERFGFSNVTGLIHSAQLDLQKLMENAAYTFDQLLHKAIEGNPDDPGAAIEKAKHRVLKQYDYDSSTVRKRIFQESLVSITLPYMKKNLDPACKTELQNLEQVLNAEHANFINVENVYESILLHVLDKEATKVVKEAASLKKFNLITDSRDLVSQSSRSSVSSPSASTPGSPAMVVAFPTESQQPSPQVLNGLHPLAMSSGQAKEEQQEKQDGASVLQSEAAVIQTPLEQKEASPRVTEEVAALAPEEDAGAVEAKVEGGGPTASAESPASAEAAEEGGAGSIQKGEADEAEAQSADAATEARAASSETATAVGRPEARTNAEEAAAQSDARAPKPEEPLAESAEGVVLGSEEDTPEVDPEAPSGGEGAALPPADGSLFLKAPPTATGSDPSSLNVSVGSESPPSDVESFEDVSLTSDLLGEEVNTSKSPDDPSDDQPVPELSDASAASGVNVEAAVATPNSATAEEAPPSSHQPQPPDCIQEAGHLTEEPAQPDPSTDPKDA